MGGEGPELCKSTEGVAWGRQQRQADTLPRAIKEAPVCRLLGAWWLRCGRCGACGWFSGFQGGGRGGLEGGGTPVGGAHSLKLGEDPCPLCFCPPLSALHSFLHTSSPAMEEGPPPFLHFLEAS